MRPSFIAFFGAFKAELLQLKRSPLLITLTVVQAVTFIFLVYFSILDLGLGTSIIKYISQYSAKDDKKTLEKVIGTALTAYILVGLLGGMLIVLLTKIIVIQFLHIPAGLIPLALSVFYLYPLSSSVVNLVNTFFYS